MSTFTSAWHKHPRRINIDERADGANIFISDPLWDDEYGITIAPSDAPALALAILEAAGHGKASDSSRLMQSFDLIELHVKEQERITAEAKEQAELEAEALDFMNAVRDATGARPLGGFPAYVSGIKSHYLIIARKARGMRAEK